MKSTVFRALKIFMPIIGIASIIILPPWDIVRAWLAHVPNTVQQQVDNAIKHGLEGIIVYIDQGGNPPAFYSAGWNNRASQEPIDPHALFKIASISKLYIATAAAKIISDGHLSPDAKLADLLPDLAERIEYAEQITFRMMLQHRSGIPNFTDVPNFPWSNPLKEVNDHLALVLDHPADFKPDQRYRYSNTNYLLVAKILDKTLGYSHHRYITQEILEPLNLHQTHHLLSQADPEKVVSGYYQKYGDDLKGLDYIVPGGSMVATAQDVGIFLRALNNGTLLNQNEQAIYSSIYQYEHTGLLPGYQSIARYHKDIDAVVIQFVNTSGGNAWPISEIVYNRIIRIIRMQ